jgi:AbrB family looped-hinge helix DNA binding protein
MRQVVRARITSKFQATLPKEVRNTLHLKAHDQILYEITDDNQVLLHKATPLDIDYLQAINYTLTEWETAADEQAYKDL